MKKYVLLACLFNLTCALGAERLYECSPAPEATNIKQSFSYIIKEKTILGLVQSVQLGDAQDNTWIDCEKDYETGHALCGDWVYPYKRSHVLFLNTEFNCERIQ